MRIRKIVGPEQDWTDAAEGRAIDVNANESTANANESTMTLFAPQNVLTMNSASIRLNDKKVDASVVTGADEGTVILLAPQNIKTDGPRRCLTMV